MNSRYWEKAAPTNAPVAYYLCYTGRLTVFQKEQVKSYLPTVERLPYTENALVNRFERGADVPEQWKAQIFELKGAA